MMADEFKFDLLILSAVLNIYCLPYSAFSIWPIPTLKQLLMEAGFSGISFQRIGRIPVFAKSMIAVARRTQNI